ncbi:MAG: hypothetical protein PHI31_08735 [Desulfuromonadaceae bacterium]|nr:hypothetical protein [Desulfuromonadaceae bacterium]
MSKVFCRFILLFLLFVPVAVLHAGQLPASLEQYQTQTANLLTGEEDEHVRKYLSECLEASRHLNGIEAEDVRVTTAFQALVAARLAAAGGLTAETSGAPGIRTEQRLYTTHVQPYLKNEYISLVRLQDQLLQRKYFRNETAKNANFIEGAVNSYWSLTRADHTDLKNVAADPHLGVSPWEAVFRLEPTLAVHHGGQFAVMGSAGLSYAFFPDVRHNGTSAVFNETFWSKWLQKSGGRLGVGAGQVENKTRFLAGAGVQIASAGLWGIYEPERRTFMFGISAADLSKLKKVVSWLE